MAKKEEKPVAEDTGDDDGEKKQDDDKATPENTEAKATMDNFLSGKKPNGKYRKCTDFLCLLLIVSVLVYFFIHK